MNRKELKPIELENNLGKDVNGVVHRVPWKAYDIEEADSVMGAMEARIAELEAENARMKSFCDRLVKDCKWLHTDRTPDKHGFETMVLCTNGKKRVAKFRMFDLRWYDVNNGDRLNVVKWLWQPKMPTTEESSETEKD